VSYIRKINGEVVTDAEYEAYRRRNRKEIDAKWQDMFRSKKAPGLAGDDTTFFNAFGTLHDQLGNQTEMVVQAAKEQGYTPGENDVYMGSVARGIGDPEAFFNAGRGRAEMKKTIEENFGTASVGRWVETKNVDRPEAKPIALADDIVEDHYKEMVFENPDVLRRDKGEVKHEIVQRHGRNRV
jgi:hypothetical protein